MKTIVQTLIYLCLMQLVYSDAPPPTFEYLIKKEKGKTIYFVQGNQKSLAELKKALALPESLKKELLVRINVETKIKRNEVLKQLTMLQKLKFQKAQLFIIKSNGTIDITAIINLNQNKIVIPEIKD